MDLRPVAAIAAISPVNVERAPDEVTPPFALDGKVPMEDDSYSASSTDEQDRELEEAEPEESDEETPAISSFPDDPPRKVNLFA